MPTGMLEIAIMVEGQNDLTWPRWQRIGRAVEDLGYVGLFRSDHFTNAGPPDLASLELWISLTWLASHTRRIQFGQLVSPVSFRHPVFLARMGSQVDDLSGGRFSLGVGAGWQEREHEIFGFDLLRPRERMDRLAEALEVITRLLDGNGPVSYQGSYYRLNEAVLLPRPQRPGGPPITVGGKGRRRSLPLAARYADEWNATFTRPEQFADLNRYLDELLSRQGRPPGAVRRSVMANIVFGRDEAEVQRKLGGRNVAELRERGIIVGAPGAVIDQLGRLAEAGVQRVQLQWLDVDDIDGLEALAHSVLGKV